MPGLVPGIGVFSLGVDGRRLPGRPDNSCHKPANMKARVTVTLKSGILDPQGKAIEGALRSLGVAGVASVRQGKVFDIELEGGDRAKAEALLKQAADKLLGQYRDRELPGGRAGMKSAVLVFPGINRERDMARTLKLISGQAPAMVWHADTALAGRHRSGGDPGRLLLRRLSALRRDRGAQRRSWTRCARMPSKGGLVLGVCNGFQILCEAGLLPGVLMRNAEPALHLPRRLSARSSAPTRRSPAATMRGR